MCAKVGVAKYAAVIIELLATNLFPKDRSSLVAPFRFLRIIVTFIIHSLKFVI
jgi:hypothetical protein